jgi:hypothetical protein
MLVIQKKFQDKQSSTILNYFGLELISRKIRN